MDGGRAPRLLIAYDGSPDSQRAVEVAGRLLDGGEATLLTVWEPAFVQLSSFAPPLVPPPDGDELGRREAERVAREGAALARRAGFEVHPRWEADGAPVWREIVDVADEIDATVIVSGTRGLTGLRSALSGSVAAQLVHHAGRPVLVVPARRDAD